MTHTTGAEGATTNTTRDEALRALGEWAQEHFETLAWVLGITEDSRRAGNPRTANHLGDVRRALYRLANAVPAGGLRIGSEVSFRDHTGATSDAVVIRLIGQPDRELGQTLCIRTADGREIYTNDRTLTVKEG